MEDNMTFGFWDQFPTSFVKPSQYKRFLPAKKGYLTGFILIIVALIFLIETVIPFAAWDVSVGGIENLITNGVPTFTLKDGEFHMDSPIEFNLSSAIHLKVDSSVERYEQEDLSDDYEEEFLISKNNLIMRYSSMGGEIDFSKHKDFVFNNESLIALVPTLKATAVITFIILYVISVFTYLISVLFLALLFKRAVSRKTDKKLCFADSFAIAAYARAPFVLLTSVDACLGYQATYTFMMIAGVFLTIRYIYIAQESYLGVSKDKSEKRPFGF